MPPTKLINSSVQVLLLVFCLKKLCILLFLLHLTGRLSELPCFPALPEVLLQIAKGKISKMTFVVLLTKYLQNGKEINGPGKVWEEKEKNETVI